MSYEFTIDDLTNMERTIGFDWIDFPMLAYRFWHKLDHNTPLDVRLVEDFIMAFMSQYNSKVRANTF